MTIEDIRLECVRLSLAQDISRGRSPVQEVVSRAQAYYDFIVVPESSALNQIPDAAT